MIFVILSHLYLGNYEQIFLGYSACNALENMVLMKLTITNKGNTRKIKL